MGENDESVRSTYTRRVADLFIANVGEWVSTDALMRVGGRCGWRSRVSDCRIKLGMDIENRLRSVLSETGKYTVSEYRYLPPEPEPPRGPYTRTTSKGRRRR